MHAPSFTEGQSEVALHLLLLFPRDHHILRLYMSVSVHVFVCVQETERESVSVPLCVCERE